MQPIKFKAIVAVSGIFDPSIMDLPEKFEESIHEYGTEGWHDFPKDPGLYECSVEYIFHPGTYEGWPAPGESDFEFIIKESKLLARWDSVRKNDPK